jgi:hypothetical protein
MSILLGASATPSFGRLIKFWQNSPGVEKPGIQVYGTSVCWINFLKVDLLL